MLFELSFAVVMGQGRFLAGISLPAPVSLAAVVAAVTVSGVTVGAGAQPQLCV